jgi:hypothetical protein
MAMIERAPTRTAHTARPKIAASWWHTPRRARGSSTAASTGSNRDRLLARDCAAVSNRPIAEIDQG